MRVVAIVIFLLAVLGAGGCSIFWLSILAFDPMWRDMALWETLALSLPGLAVCIAATGCIYLLGNCKTGKALFAILAVLTGVLTFGFMLNPGSINVMWSLPGLLVSAGCAALSVILPANPGSAAD